MIEVTLRIQGVDLSDEALDDIIAVKFPNTSWNEVDGMTTLTLYVDREDAAAQVMEQTRQLEAALPTLKVVGMDRDLVGTTEVAHRAGVSREAARKWTMAKDFPAPFAYISTGSMKLWAWTQVLEWLKQTRAVEFDEELPSLELMTQIENCIMRNPDHTTVQWQQLKRTAAAPSAFATVVTATAKAGGRAQGIVSPAYELVGAAARGH